MKAAKPTDHYTEPMPKARITIDLDFSFTPQEMEIIRLGSAPEVMEDKWFLYWLDNTLYCHRSWTGHCIFAVHFSCRDGTWKMVSVEVNNEPSQYRRSTVQEDMNTIFDLLFYYLCIRGPNYPDDEIDDGIPG